MYFASSYILLLLTVFQIFLYTGICNRKLASMHVHVCTVNVHYLLLKTSTGHWTWKADMILRIACVPSIPIQAKENWTAKNNFSHLGHAKNGMQAICSMYWLTYCQTVNQWVWKVSAQPVGVFKKWGACGQAFLPLPSPTTLLNNEKPQFCSAQTGMLATKTILKTTWTLR